MSQSVEIAETRDGASADGRRLELTIYQIVDDGMLKRNRDDGTGWEWSWANWQRAWMDASPGRFAYRCLPLTIANQTGFWVANPVGFTAIWRGGKAPESIDFAFDRSADVWQKWISNEFGLGIITWNTPFLFRSKPEGSRLLICGPANDFKVNAHPLTAIIESDWMTMSFTMNWKIMKPGEPVRFELGEPLFQATPIVSNVCSDLEAALVTYKMLLDDPAVAHDYREWDQSRLAFMERSKAGGVKPHEWQRDYFLGRDASGRHVAPLHMTKVKPPNVHYEGTAAQQTEDSLTLARARPTSGSQEHAPSEAHNGTFEKAPPFHPVTDDWRRWIAENVMLGGSRESILQVMTQGGLSPAESASEIDLACQSPYLRGAERLYNRLSKREWLLAAYRKLNRLRTDSGTIERRHQLSRGEFLDRYYCASRPVIITGMMDDWPALGKWSLEYFVGNLAAARSRFRSAERASDSYEARSRSIPPEDDLLSVHRHGG